MNFVKPANADILDAAQQSSGDQSEDGDSAVTLAWAPEGQQDDLSMSSAIEANATQLATIQETLEDLRESIEEQRQALAEQNGAIQGIRSAVDQLEGLVDTGRSERQSQLEDIDALQQRMDELAPIQDDIATIESRLNEVEKTTTSLRTRFTHQKHDSARLLAAVFNESQPCPMCENGQLERKGGFIDPYRLVCNQCDFEEEISIQ